MCASRPVCISLLPAPRNCVRTGTLFVSCLRSSALASRGCVIRQINDNAFTGTIPAGISALTKLSSLYALAPCPTGVVQAVDGLLISYLRFCDIGIVRMRDQAVDGQRVHRDRSGRHLRTDGAQCSVRRGRHASPVSFNLWTAYGRLLWCSALNGNRFNGSLPSAISTLTRLNVLYTSRPSLFRPNRRLPAFRQRPLAAPACVRLCHCCPYSSARICAFPGKVREAGI